MSERIVDGAAGEDAPSGAERLIPFPERAWAAAPALPRSRSSLIGREREITAVSTLLLQDDVPLLTLTGPGGVGKTRLAREVAAAVAERFPDGVWFVELAAITDPALVVPTIAHALGVRDGSDEPLLDRLARVLRGKRSLLLLDNFEQVIEAAPDIATLLGACPDLTILVTSRARLRVSGEHEHPVPPLAVAKAPIGEVVIESEAVRLFAARARALDNAFALTPDTAPVIAAICRRLDGLPLAIELATARIKALPLPALLARLERRLPLLTGGGRDLPARQQTMRSTIAWSHDLLTPGEQMLFRRLSVFAGGFTLAAAEAVVDEYHDDASMSMAVLDGVASLVENSLLRQDRQDAGSGTEPRYLMLETVREYALEQLEASDEAEQIRERHAIYVADLVEAIAPYLEWRAEVAEPFARLDAEQDNIRAALTWSAGRGQATIFVRLAAALQSYWAMRGRLRRRSPVARSGGDRGGGAVAAPGGRGARGRLDRPISWRLRPGGTARGTRLAAGARG